MPAEKRSQKIKKLIKQIIEPSIRLIKNSRKRKNMPYKEIGAMLKIFFPKTKHCDIGKGYYKHVFIVHSNKRKFALKVCSKARHVRKDFNTYNHLIKRLGEKKTNRYYAKIYWREGLFLLQKYGKKIKKMPPPKQLTRLENFAKGNGLIDAKKKANIMKFGNSFKIVDAEMSQRIK